MEDLSFRTLPTYNIDADATTPNPGGFCIIKSAVTNGPLMWDTVAGRWRMIAFIHIGNTAPVSPNANTLWVDTN